MRSSRYIALAAALTALALVPGRDASGREPTSRVEIIDHIPAMREKYPVPKEPNMLFFIERSVNSNTVVYAARMDETGHFDRDTPIDAYWRWYNVDGAHKALNFIERSLAYGVKSVSEPDENGAIGFNVAALPERRLVLKMDKEGHPEALMRLGDHMARLVYVFLEVDDHGLMPSVTAFDIFGIDEATGAALHEHVTLRSAS